MSVTYADDKLVRGSEVLEMYAEAGWTLLAGRSPEQVEESVRNSTVFLTARDGAKLVGFIAAIGDRSYYAHVTELLVRERYAGRGVTAGLLDRLVADLKSERVISIFAAPDDDAPYLRVGFAATAGGMLLQRDHDG